MIIDKLRRTIRFAANKKQPEMRETLAALSTAGTYNPDALVTSKGHAIYEEMQTDAQVAACLNIKKFAVLSRGWQVHPASDSEEDNNTAEFIRFCLRDMRGSILDTLHKSLDALAKGFSVMEINYRALTEHPFRGMIGLESIKAKDPMSLRIEVDEYQNVTGIKGQWDSDAVLPADKFVIYTYMPRYESPFGQSDLRAVYKYWWCKKAIISFFNIYLEKYGCPTAKGAYGKSTGKQQQEELLRALDKIRSETAIVVPEDFTVELLESKRGGDAAYLNALEYHDRQIAKAILGQTLTVDQGSSSGSYAQAKVHLEVMRLYLEKLKRDLEESVVGEQIIRRLVDYNFPHKRYPRFTLGPMEDRDLAVLGDLITKLIDGKVIAPDETWIREYLGIPEAASRS